MKYKPIFMYHFHINELAQLGARPFCVGFFFCLRQQRTVMYKLPKIRNQSIIMVRK